LRWSSDAVHQTIAGTCPWPLRERLTDRDTTIAALAVFRTTAVSQLAAQHEEILQLRRQLANRGNVRLLHPKVDNGQPD
jgi:hypothetical protein